MRKLNEGQIETLKVLYKFRFGSALLIAKYFHKNRGEFLHNRLQILVQSNLLNKRFNNNYRLQGKPASYSLSPKGARAVQEYLNLDEPINLKTIYANKTVSEPFIEHCLNIFETFNTLTSSYNENLKFFTKVELTSGKYGYFPKPLPDAFISLKKSEDTQRYFVELIEDSIQPFLLKKRVKQYIAYEESGEWAATGKEFPTILFVCESEKTQKKVEKLTEKALNQAWSEDAVFKVTSKHNLTLSQI